MSEIKKDSKDPEVVEKRVQADLNLSGTVTTRKKSEIRKFTDVFITEDIQNVKTYILTDVLIPAAKKAISDIVTNGIDMILYPGEGGRRRSERRSGTGSHVSYRSYYDNDRRETVRAGSYRTGFEFDDIIFDNRGDAERVLSVLEDCIDRYQIVSVGDFYDIAQVPCSNFNANKYGWTDLSRASVQRCPDGYYLRLPKALPLN